MTPQEKGRRILPVFFVPILGLALLVAAPSLARAAIDSDLLHANAATPHIRVLLKDRVRSLEVSGWDLQVSSRSASSAPLQLRNPGRQSWVWTCDRRGVRGRRIGRQTGPVIEFSGAVKLESPAGTLLWNSRLIRESMTLFPSNSGCRVVNGLDIEKYLEGVVNGEFSSQWNAEAIAAQVIAARTYALYQIREARRKGRHYDVDSTTRDQVYLGAAGEDFKASQAVAGTRGLVVTETQNPGRPFKIAPIKAFYHSTCGGVTESARSVFGEDHPSMHQGVQCLHCGSSPRFRWRLEVSQAQMDHALKGYRRGGVRQVEVLSRFPSGRVKTVRVNFVSGTEIVPAARLRLLMGADVLKSTYFELTHSGTWHFEGRGFGHGVGMCQWGAKEMGAAGYPREQILSHYYPGTRLLRAWQ